MLRDFIHNFHLLRPWVLLLLLIPFSFYFYVFKNNSNLSTWEKVCDKNLLKYLLIKGKSTKRKLSVFFMYLGLISAVFAASGPSWKKIETDAINNHTPVMILLNLSTDMLDTDIKPNRLDRAKIEIAQFLKQLKSTESGLIVYTQEPFLISSLSADYEIIINLLDSINTDIMPVNGDRLDRAIEFAATKINDAGYENGNIIVFTAESGTSFNAAEGETSKLSRLGFNVSVVNVSNSENQKLKQIAKTGNGQYFQVGQDMQSLVKDITEKKENFKKSKNKAAEWLDFGWYLLAIPMLCCLSFFRKGALVVAFFLSYNLNAHAGFLYSDNYEAMKSFEEKDYNSAAQGFKNEKWKGVALYKVGDYENAAKMFAGKTDIESVYNYANALAKGGKIEEAMAKYEEVLKQNPKHEDAKFNLEYLKKQQQQNNSKNQKKDNKQNKEQNQNKQEQNNEQNQNQNEQKQPAEQEQKQEENKNEQEAKAQNMNAQAQAEEEQDKKQSKDESKDNRDNKQNKMQNQNMQEQQSPKMQAKQGDKDEKYDEEVQAKVQRFREIPEDKGGLLRAFINQEYLKKRYGD